MTVSSSFLVVVVMVYHIVLPFVSNAKGEWDGLMQFRWAPKVIENNRSVTIYCSLYPHSTIHEVYKANNQKG